MNNEEPTTDRISHQGITATQCAFEGCVMIESSRMHPDGNQYYDRLYLEKEDVPTLIKVLQRLIDVPRISPDEMEVEG